VDSNTSAAVPLTAEETANENAAVGLTADEWAHLRPAIEALVHVLEAAPQFRPVRRGQGKAARALRSLREILGTLPKERAL
jgi:hypothetical protein